MSRYSFEIPGLFLAFVALGIAGANDVEDAKLSEQFERSIMEVTLPDTYNYYADNTSLFDGKKFVSSDVAVCRVFYKEAAAIADVAADGELFFSSDYGDPVVFNKDENTCTYKDLTFKVGVGDLFATLTHP